MTNGNKNTMKSESANLTKFWELNKNRKTQSKENQVRTWELMKNLAEEIIKNNEIETTNKYYEFIVNVANGDVVYNKFGKKLYFKLGDKNE